MKADGREPRDAQDGPAGRVPVQQPLGEHRKDRRRRAVQDRRTESPDDPQRDPRVVVVAQVREVLDQRESGPDGEPDDGGVDKEAEAALAQGDHDEDGLQRLLGQGRRIVLRTGSDTCRASPAQTNGHRSQRAGGPRRDGHGDVSVADQLEAVHQEQDGQEGDHRKKSRGDV